MENQDGQTGVLEAAMKINDILSVIPGAKKYCAEVTVLVKLIKYKITIEKEVEENNKTRNVLFQISGQDDSAYSSCDSSTVITSDACNPISSNCSASFQGSYSKENNVPPAIKQNITPGCVSLPVSETVGSKQSSQNGDTTVPDQQKDKSAREEIIPLQDARSSVKKKHDNVNASTNGVQLSNVSKLGSSLPNECGTNVPQSSTSKQSTDANKEVNPQISDVNATNKPMLLIPTTSKSSVKELKSLPKAISTCSVNKVTPEPINTAVTCPANSPVSISVPSKPVNTLQSHASPLTQPSQAVHHSATPVINSVKRNVQKIKKTKNMYNSPKIYRNIRPAVPLVPHTTNICPAVPSVPRMATYWIPLENVKSVTVSPVSVSQATACSGASLPLRGVTTPLTEKCDTVTKTKNNDEHLLPDANITNDTSTAQPMIVPSTMNNLCSSKDSSNTSNKESKNINAKQTCSKNVAANENVPDILAENGIKDPESNNLHSSAGHPILIEPPKICEAADVNAESDTTQDIKDIEIVPWIQSADAMTSPLKVDPDAVTDTHMESTVPVENGSKKNAGLIPSQLEARFECANTNHELAKSGVLNNQLVENPNNNDGKTTSATNSSEQMIASTQMKNPTAQVVVEAQTSHAPPLVLADKVNHFLETAESVENVSENNLLQSTDDNITQNKAAVKTIKRGKRVTEKRQKVLKKISKEKSSVKAPVFKKPQDPGKKKPTRESSPVPSVASSVDTLYKEMKIYLDTKMKKKMKLKRQKQRKKKHFLNLKVLEPIVLDSDLESVLDTRHRGPKISTLRNDKVKNSKDGKIAKKDEDKDRKIKKKVKSKKKQNTKLSMEPSKNDTCSKKLEEKVNNNDKGMVKRRLRSSDRLSMGTLENKSLEIEEQQNLLVVSPNESNASLNTKIAKTVIVPNAETNLHSKNPISPSNTNESTSSKKAKLKSNDNSSLNKKVKIPIDAHVKNSEVTKSPSSKGCSKDLVHNKNHSTEIVETPCQANDGKRKRNSEQLEPTEVRKKSKKTKPQETDVQLPTEKSIGDEIDKTQTLNVEVLDKKSKCNDSENINIASGLIQKSVIRLIDIRKVAAIRSPRPKTGHLKRGKQPFFIDRTPGKASEGIKYSTKHRVIGEIKIKSENETADQFGNKEKENPKENIQNIDTVKQCRVPEKMTCQPGEEFISIRDIKGRFTSPKSKSK